LYAGYPVRRSLQLLHLAAATLAYAATALYALSLSVNRPFHNWDVVAYIATAKAFEQSDPVTLHTFAYTELRTVLTADQYEELAREHPQDSSRGTVYRHAMSSDPVAFVDQLPFYQIKPAYNALVFALHKSGIDIELATHLISGVAIAIAVLIVGWLAIATLAPPLVYLLPLLAWQFGVLDLARFSTPDAFAFLAIIAAVALLLRERFAAALIILPLALAIRPDLLLLTAPLMAILVLAPAAPRFRIILSGLASAAVYFAVTTHWKAPPWTTFFYCYCSPGLRCLHPLAETHAFSPPDYIAALARGARALVVEPNFLLFAAIVTAAAWLLWQLARITTRSVVFSPPAALIAACVVYMTCHFLILPDEWRRFFSTAYLLVALATLVLLNNWLVARRPSPGHSRRPA
jgi:hypothetical protein